MSIDKVYDNELEECKKQLIQLRNENDELLSELHKVNEKLCDSEQLKGHFISNVSNEIVNPFSSIVALSQGIKQLNAGEIQEAHHMASLILDEAFHLDFQLQNIFAAALIEAGKEEVQSSVVDLNELLQQIDQYFHPLLEKKQIRLLQSIGNSSAKFSTDKEKLELILKNLVSNSIKYSPENSTIGVSLSRVDSSLKIEVSDQGKGIHTEDRNIVFDRFKQLDEKINSINTGHGLGLSIVKAYTEMLDGNVELIDNKHSGITLRVIIPECMTTEKWDDLDGFIFDAEARY